LLSLQSCRAEAQQSEQNQPEHGQLNRHNLTPPGRQRWDGDSPSPLAAHELRESLCPSWDPGCASPGR